MRPNGGGDGQVAPHLPIVGFLHLPLKPLSLATVGDSYWTWWTLNLSQCGNSWFLCKKKQNKKTKQTKTIL